MAGVEALENARKFAVDFRGGRLGSLPADAPVEPVVNVAGGHVVSRSLDLLPEGTDGEGSWRVVLDVAAERGAMVEMSLHLAGFGERLSEDWAFQWNNA